MDKRRIGLLFLVFLLIPHRAQSTRRSLKQGDCSDCGPGCVTQVSSLRSASASSAPEPFLVSVRNLGGRHICGGTLIAPNIVLTAAHCISDRRGGFPIGKNPKVHVGRLKKDTCDGNDFEVFRTVRAIPHPQFIQGAQFDNDVALLVLDSFSLRKPIQLASSDSCFESRGGCRVRFLGWGDTTGERKAELPELWQEKFITSVSRGTCEAQLGPGLLTRNMICAGEPQGGVGACLGFGGSPLILQSGEQVGIVSFGIGCARPNQPEVYTNVPRLLGWIQDEVDKVSGSFLGDCDCSRFGVSGGVNTGMFGCARHLLEEGDSRQFCMVRGGTRCSSATESVSFPGAAQKGC